jgi:F-type H+-transporting ATPase subunit b
MEVNATFLLQLALICLLMFFLEPILFRPIMRLFDEREKRIVGAAEDAKRYLGAADEKSALAEQKTAAAQHDARAVLATLRAQGAEREAKLVEDARTAAATRLEEAREQLFDATESARRTLKDDAKKIADEIVAKVLGRAA